MCSLLKLLLLLIFVKTVSAARILCVFPTPCLSHQIVFRSLTQELAQRGHELVIVTPDPVLSKDRSKDNITEIDVHDLSYDMMNKILTDNDLSNKGNEISTPFGFLEIMKDMLFDMAEKQLRVPEMAKIINSKNEYFDLIIIEPLFRANCFLAHKFKAPLIGFVSLQAPVDAYEHMGAPVHPILYPDSWREKLEFTWWEKLNVLNEDYKLRHLFISLKRREDEYIEKFLGKEVLQIDECRGLMDLLLVNVNPVWTGARPLPPNIVNVGGIHTVKGEKTLPTDLQNYLDNSVKGVVYVSFGSNVKSSDMKTENVNKFVNAFARLPYDVLWKWETDELQGKPDNVRIAKWLPQSDLLRHPNIKLFVTQGGLQSTDEAIAARVPLLGIPFFGDQNFNVQRYLKHGVGLVLRFETITEDQIHDTILEVTNNKTYKHNMERISALMSDEPLPPLERAVWWTEYVIRHKGARHLRPPSAGLSCAQYYMLDLLALCAGAALVALATLWIIFKYLATIKRNYLKAMTKDGNKHD